MKKTEIIDKICILDLKPGNILVLKSKKELDRQTCKTLKRMVTEVLKDLSLTNKVILLDASLDLEVLRKRKDTIVSDTPEGTELGKDFMV